MTHDVSSLQAMAGRLLTSREPWAWESDSMRRCVDLVKAFQVKALDADGLEAALRSERTAAATPTVQGKATAMIDLVGVLTPSPSIFSLLGFGTSLQTFRQQITVAAVDPAIRSVVIAVDSPGGSITLAMEAAQAVRALRARKPVVAITMGLNASAAYWVTSGATAIAATPSAMVGGIGVITQRESITKMLEREGVEITVVSAGRFKSEGHPATPITVAEREDLQAKVDAVYTQFVADIAVGRHTSASSIREGFGQGRVVRADDALRLGMIDRVELVEQTIARVVSEPNAFTAMCTSRTARDRQADPVIAAHRRRLEAAVARRSAR